MSRTSNGSGSVSSGSGYTVDPLSAGRSRSAAKHLPTASKRSERAFAIQKVLLRLLPVTHAPSRCSALTHPSCCQQQQTHRATVISNHGTTRFGPDRTAPPGGHRRCHARRGERGPATGSRTVGLSVLSSPPLPSCQVHTRMLRTATMAVPCRPP